MISNLFTLKADRFTVNVNRSRLFFYCFIILTITYTSLNNSAQARTKNNLIGKTSPTFVLPDTNGKQHSLREWKNKFIILNFWATWCTPCKKEIPLFNEFQTRFSDDIQFIGIAIDNNKAVKKFTQVISINYPNLIAGLQATKLILNYGNEAGVLPYTIFINQQGKIVSIAAGKITEEFLLKTIEKYL